MAWGTRLEALFAEDIAPDFTDAPLGIMSDGEGLCPLCP